MAVPRLRNIGHEINYGLPGFNILCRPEHAEHILPPAPTRHVAMRFLRPSRAETVSIHHDEEIARDPIEDGMAFCGNGGSLRLRWFDGSRARQACFAP